MHLPPAYAFLRPVVALALAASAAAQQLVAPIHMTWRASSETTSSSTTTSIMRTTLYHTQLLYEQSHFTGQGVTGPITIDRLRFRAEDTEPNLGGQVFSNVTVRLSDAPAGMTSATMTTTFANNIGANVGTPEVVNITLGAARGTIPNDYVVDIPLTTGAFTYDPTTMGALVIDIDSPAAPVPATGIVPLACATTQTTHLARGLSTTTAASLTGTLSASVPVCRFNFTGTGGTRSGIPASTQSLGASGGHAADSFYQFFNAGDPFDLQNQSFRLTPNAAFTAYTVTAGTTAPDLTQAITRASTADDAVTTLAMAWTFQFVGGSTATVKPCTNGFVWLSATPTSTDLSPTVAELLGGGTSAYPARVALAWFDLHAGRNLTTHPGSGLYANVDTSGGPGNNVTYITWREVGQFNSTSATGGHSVNTLQLVLYENSMEMELRYGRCTGMQGGTVLTGFSPGTRGASVNSTDPGSRDLSCETPFVTTGPDARPGMVLSAANASVTGSGRAIVGTTVNLVAASVPAGADVGVFLFGPTALCPGAPLPLFAPGSILSLSPFLVWSVATGFPSGGPVTSPAPLVILPRYVSATLYLQFAAFNLAAGPTNVHASNLVRMTMGLR